MARKIAVEIIGDARSLERSYAKATRATKGFGREMQGANRHVSRSRSAFSGLSRIAGLAGASIGVAGLAGAVKAFAEEALDAQKVTAQTNAAIKSTGGVANVTAKHVDELANATLKKTGIDDEAVKTAENMLLTFTKIRNEAGKQNHIFDRATISVTDLATAMNKGAVPSADQLQRASIQLGKALNDPIKGIGSLARVGIQFTKQQKDQIKTLVDSGHTVAAQRIILAELNREVGGRAVAAGKTFQGQWQILRQTVLNLGGAVAQQLMPAVQRLLSQLVKWLNNSKNQKQILDSIKQVCSALAAVVRVLAGAFKVLNSITGSTKRTLELLLAVFVAFKALKLIAYIGGMTKAMRGFAIASAEANAAGAGGGLGGGRFGKLGRLGKLGLGATVAIPAGIALSQGLRKIPGEEKFFRGIGGKVFDLTHRGDHRHVTVEMLIDGKKLATATAGHNENALAHRRKGRAHQRKSRR